MIQKVSNKRGRFICYTHFVIIFFSHLFAALVSNTFKVEKFHSLVLWKHHNPLDIKEHEVHVNAIRVLFFLFSTIGSVSNDDGDGNKNVKKVKGRLSKTTTSYAHTVFIRLNAAAFIKFLAFPMQRLFKGSVYFEINFFIITDNSHCKSFVIM